MENPFYVALWDLGLFRLLLAAVLGGIMGLERTRKRREAGFRTYMLVAVGSAMTVLVGEIMYMSDPAGDTTRIAPAAVSGIGFIGAGSIIISRSNRVVGPTTAAGVWVSVSVGLAAGCGYYIGAVALVIISVFAATIGERIEERFLRHSPLIRLSVLFDGEEHVLPFIEEAKGMGFRFVSADMERPIENCVSATMVMRLPAHEDHRDVIEKLSRLPGVVFAEGI